MKTSEALTAARQLIIQPAQWTQRYLARDKDGSPCFELGADAVCFCSVGTLWRAIPEHNHDLRPLRDQAWRILAKAIGVEEWRVAEWNDAPERTHSEVLAAFDKAIEMAEQQEATCA